MASATALIGAAGEHYVMSQLLRRGFIAALAPTGVPNADIIVTDEIGDRLCAIQVKTRNDKGGDGGWHMKRKHEDLVSERLFYAFVDLGSEDNPDSTVTCFVLPSAVVADALRRSHALWLATPGRSGQPRNDSEMRRLMPDYDKVGLAIDCGRGWLDRYKSAWNTIRSSS